MSDQCHSVYYIPFFLVQVISVTTPFSEDFRGWVAPLPRRLPATIFSVTQPLGDTVWIVVIAVLPVAGVMVRVVAWAEALALGKICPGKRLLPRVLISILSDTIRRCWQLRKWSGSIFIYMRIVLYVNFKRRSLKSILFVRCSVEFISLYLWKMPLHLKENGQPCGPPCGIASALLLVNQSPETRKQMRCMP